MTSEVPGVVFDTNGAQYELDRLLGQGGQGSVYAVRGRDLAVKLSLVKGTDHRQRVREGVARVRRLPLDGLQVARPLRALREPNVGYVMELMTGMVPLQSLLQPPKDTESLAEWYRDSGGIRRRLRLLAKTAALFRALHARGLVYGDASPQNVFVSRRLEHDEVWLIDCDNIVQGVRPGGVYTPGYAAPELLRGAHLGADSLTDAWSLATIAFETLCILHPFDGDQVHDGPPELEEKAFQGDLPWVDDPSDSSNVASSRGVPREVVLSGDLRNLAQECFGESRVDRQARPTTGAWAEKLFLGADQTLLCPACGSTYYANSRTCPWCDTARATFGVATAYLRDPELKDDERTPKSVVCKTPGQPVPVTRVTFEEGSELALTDRHLRGGCDEQPRIILRLEGTVLRLEGTETCRYFLEHRADGRKLSLAQETQRLDLGRGRTNWWIVPEAVDGIHRVVTLERHGGDEA